MKKSVSMGYDRFNILASIQVLGLAVTPLVFYWVLLKEDTLVTSVTLVLIWLFQVVYLLYFIRKTNNEIAKFLVSITHKEISQKYDTEKSGKSFEGLFRAFNMVFQAIREARIEKEAEHQYLLNTIKNVGIGLISYDRSGKIELYNAAAAEIFNRTKARTIEDLKKANPKLFEAIRKVKPNKHELLKLQLNGEKVQLSVKGFIFKIESREIKLITVQDVRSEVEAGEVEAWQKLIKILTHEITNSISPINLLSTTLLNMFKPGGDTIRVKELNQKAIDDSILGLQAIKKRSNGLKKFIESYSSFTKLPNPNFTSFRIQTLFSDLAVLFKNEFQKIELKTRINPPGLLLFADEKMIEQVLINLINNSVYFLEKRKGAMIELSAYKEKEQTIIRLSDNGPGIKEEEIENIFIPFYSTKEGGTGIGLSLSRQIMLLHKGGIAVTSKPGVRTDFILSF